jgi:hypothetical protein
VDDGRQRERTKRHRFLGRRQGYYSRPQIDRQAFDRQGIVHSREIVCNRGSSQHGGQACSEALEKRAKATPDHYPQAAQRRLPRSRRFFRR